MLKTNKIDETKKLPENDGKQTRDIRGPKENRLLLL